MLQKPSQVVSEQNPNSVFQMPKSSNQFIQCCSKGPVMSESFFSLLSTASLRLGACGPLLFKDQTGPQGPLYSVIKMVKTNKQVN